MPRKTSPKKIVEDERLSQAEVREALCQLEQAFYNHEQWSEALGSTLICRLPPDARDVGQHPHENCRFGQWYYGADSSALRRHPDFLEIGDAHEEMHRHAAKLLVASAENQPITLTEYEQFTNALNRFHLLVEALRHELDDDIYNLDPLTGASSRVGLLTKLREEQELVKRKLQTCVVAMIDIDHFKAINDTYGHRTGDVALIEVAKFVMRNSRPFDRIYRYGGEEFLICAPHTNVETAKHLMERLRSGLSELTIEYGGKEPLRLTASFGLTLLDPATPVGDSINRADLALYAAKAAGRNRVMAWDPTMVSHGDA